MTSVPAPITETPSSDTLGGSASVTLSGPMAEYERRKMWRQEAVATGERHREQLGLARLALAAVAGVVAWLSLGLGWWPAWLLLVPAAAFVGLLFAYDQVGRRILRAERAVRFYERGLERLNGAWANVGNPGTRFRNDEHPFAQDVDLFGPASVFERLCLARTAPGEDTLARWLLHPADAATVQARQAAVLDLRDRLDLREDLALRGADVPTGVDFAALVRWAETPAQLTWAGLRSLLLVVSTLNLLAVLLWLLVDPDLVPFPTLLPLGIMILVSVAVGAPFAPAVRRVLLPLEPMVRAVTLLAGVLARYEHEQVTAPRLRTLQADLQAAGQPPSEWVHELARLIESWHNQRNQLFLPFALLWFWNTQTALAIERWRHQLRAVGGGSVIAGWLTALGELEALSSLAAYAYECPGDVMPEVVDLTDVGGPVLEGTGLGHPLLPLQRCVRNDVRLGSDVQLLLISGSNMSGKSTFLRTVGVNTVLALAGGVVRAERFRLTPFALGATLRVQDSLAAGRSRFYAEITRIRQIVEIAQGPIPLLFLLDEVLAGTNSHDRGIGATAVVERLLASGAVGFVTTHDLALTTMAERFAPRAVNVHFADQFTDGALSFDYHMRPGVVPHSNALALMRAVGLAV
jgi:hypothetical protein